MSASPTRTRARLLLAATAALAALVLTACKDGEGLRDEGPSSVSSPTSHSAPGRTP
ncbi:MULTISPECIES: hypothetical protein [unclassified Streptomyces]|uniref:hypothetical protein n=1 Tax=unclassified Streptomyces TaxID=2593676 RepID=UPI0022522BAF|nr:MULTISPECIES: hypothetical protein [unclassified Streptomyces]MCX5050135.1 hypothetical protein [Streptomyces sp. NBC_00474]MCX5060533.1 hypothetical protein [Streptomyces sp. NBC_00452]MCX5248066.1 hypothetical protein [Streptomyces sp. NBC_00201]MCX5293875.1 hypothetical protein [Streptomyces sp. NBC_00183]